MCFFFHKWTMWKMCSADRSTYVDGKIVVMSVTKQMRSCKRCGKTQVRELK